MENQKIIYHGSSRVIKMPQYGIGKIYNDYGLGFYCTEHIELAKEWACTSNEGGYVNKYILDASNLSILDITEMHVLEWLALLLDNRKFLIRGALAIEAREYILREFLVNISEKDIVIGYRADDSYFSFATGFLNGSLSLAQLTKAIKLGRLGQQIVLKSERAFKQIYFQEFEEVKQEIYYAKRLTRDLDARTEFQKLKDKQKASESVYVLDILREGWRKDDLRL